MATKTKLSRTDVVRGVAELVGSLPRYHCDMRTGGRIAERREARGLSQRELAFPGCSYAYISRLEAGMRRPSLNVLLKLAVILDVSPRYLAWGEEPKRFKAQEFKHVLLFLGISRYRAHKEYLKFVATRGSRTRQSKQAK